MDTTEIAAWTGAIAGSFGALAGSAALLWDITKWREEKRRVRVESLGLVTKSDIPDEYDGKIITFSQPGLMWGQFEVVNIGDVSVVVKRAEFFLFSHWWTRILNLPIRSQEARNGAIPPWGDPAVISEKQCLPVTLEPGERWRFWTPAPHVWIKSTKPYYIGVFFSWRKKPVLCRSEFKGLGYTDPSELPRTTNSKPS